MTPCDRGHRTRLPGCPECWWISDHDPDCTPAEPNTATCCAPRVVSEDEACDECGLMHEEGEPDCTPDLGIPAQHIEYLCRVMHTAYEDEAARVGWKTQPASRAFWEDVPEANKAAMRAGVRALLDRLFRPESDSPDCATGPPEPAAGVNATSVPPAKATTMGAAAPGGPAPAAGVGREQTCPFHDDGMPLSAPLDVVCTCQPGCLTLDEAQRMHDAALSVIEHRQLQLHPQLRGFAVTLNADRERLASDLAGVRDHRNWNQLGVCGSTTHDARLMTGTWPCPDFRRYADGLRRTAALYGLTEGQPS